MNLSRCSNAIWNWDSDWTWPSSWGEEIKKDQLTTAGSCRHSDLIVSSASSSTAPKKVSMSPLEDPPNKWSRTFRNNAIFWVSVVIKDILLTVGICTSFSMLSVGDYLAENVGCKIPKLYCIDLYVAYICRRTCGCSWACFVTCLSVFYVCACVYCHSACGFYDCFFLFPSGEIQKVYRPVCLSVLVCLSVCLPCFVSLSARIPVS